MIDRTVQAPDTNTLPNVLPILPLFDAVLFPKMVLPLVVMQEESIRLVDEAMQSDRLIGLLVAQNTSPGKTPSQSELEVVGACATIMRMAKTKENHVQLLVQGLRRFAVSRFVERKPYYKAEVGYLKESPVEDVETKALMNNLIAVFEKIAELSPGMPEEVIAMARAIKEPGTLADMITSTINSPVAEKQLILEAVDIKARLKAVIGHANHQRQILELGQKIQSQAKSDMEKTQREYYLRQQLKAIQEELGDTDDGNVELDEYRQKIEQMGLPDEARKEAERELKRLERMHPSSAEYTVATTYLDWITALPWHKTTKDNLDLKKARAVLDKDHYGLEKAKKRIVEYLAVRKLKEDSKGPILCFAGPPGTGKTSLGASIARAMGRKFHRLSVGGVRDEAEIRGHRRTYVGALPGRVIQALRRTGSKNPVLMLDEIDKVGSDFRGDPSSALLEVLDPEQNHTFTDHYLDVPFDLSGVMFITTANMLDTIPPALLDRMEVIALSGYTLDEKMVIAKRHLIPRQRKAHGLTAGQIKITGGALKTMIQDYTRESGLRSLEREIATLCRSAAAQIATEKARQVKVRMDNVSDFLGTVKFVRETRARKLIPGIATGLAWTPVGGELLFIEATSMAGDKGVTLTGQLGDVMKESATAALSFIRSNAKKLSISDDYFTSHDIHVHVPAGAIPKDGPSAGVTMLTALVSLMTGRTIKKDLAMTGEITLRGQVLPVGGIKEKVLAAHRAGIKTIILPSANLKDMDDVPAKVKKEITFHHVGRMMHVLKLALTAL